MAGWSESAERYVTAWALADGGRTVAGHLRRPPQVPALAAWQQRLGGSVTVAMEATLYRAWRHEQHRAAGVAAVATRPYEMKLIWQARCKTDVIDAGRPVAGLLVRVRTQLKSRIRGRLTPEDG